MAYIPHIVPQEPKQLALYLTEELQRLGDELQRLEQKILALEEPSDD